MATYIAISKNNLKNTRITVKNASSPEEAFERVGEAIKSLPLTVRHTIFHTTVYKTID